MVTTLKGLSGFSWDAEREMNIGIDDKCAWDAYILVCLYSID
jgi:hypothetical protein